MAADKSAAALVKKLYERPKREPAGLVADYNNAPELNSVHQMDLLQLPSDRGRGYALVVYDVATRRTAARPLASKSAGAVLRALRDVYENDLHLRPPQRAEVDGGAEFRGAVAEYLREKGAVIRVGLPGRHRQQAGVEALNGVIGRAIFKAQAAREIETGRTSKAWVADLPGIIAAENRHLERKPPPPPSGALPPPADAQDRVILDVGTMVRRVLDRPEDVLGRVLPPGRGKTGRRLADPTYERTPRPIVGLVLRPGMSPRYVLRGLPTVSFARYELQRA